MTSDDDLLARLNALKKSSVNLDTSYSSSIAPGTPPKPTDDLAARFARLGSASPSGPPQPSRAASINDTHVLGVAPGATGYLEGITEGIGGDKVEFNEEDEKSLEGLLGELNGALGDRKEWDISKNEHQDVGKLLKDMKKILPKVVDSRAQDANPGNTTGISGTKEHLTGCESIEVNVGSGCVTGGKDDDDSDHSEDDGGRKWTEEDEADDVIARVMAELEISKERDPPSPASEGNGDPQNGDQKTSPGEISNQNEGDNLSLPSVPTELPEDDFERTQMIEDAFTARLAALSAPSPSHTDALGLPSAPSFSPRKKPPIQSSLQQRIDDEIETWCIICQDDATLKCIDCDNDLYCQNCWMEGHRGEGTGLEERRHKAVLYSKKKKQAAV
ncbi:hypothetical protein GQ44DRAFT_754537 [Phaeosphaeriaceae sp. PMI808]|nr:hypothetical protein GQ44DRAFT_754537 [Phaeosphaeriaceae sp. PMI808]